MPVPLRRIATTALRSLWAGPSQVCRLPHRVRLGYVDLNWHMNYASYLEVMELGRWDWALRNRVLAHWLHRRLWPVVIQVDIHYRRELRPLTRFEVDTRIVGVDRRIGTFQQHLLVADRVHAKADVRFLLLQRSRVVDAATVAEVMGPFVVEPLETVGQRVVQRKPAQPAC